MAESTELPREHLEILWHSLGIDKKNAGKSLQWWLDPENHRDHYCVEVANTKTVAQLTLLVERGFMIAGRTINGGQDRYYHVAENGVIEALRHFPGPERKGLTK